MRRKCMQCKYLIMQILDQETIHSDFWKIFCQNNITATQFQYICTENKKVCWEHFSGKPKREIKFSN